MFSRRRPVSVLEAYTLFSYIGYGSNLAVHSLAMLDEKTVVLRGEKATMNAALQFIANAKKRINVCGDWLAPRSLVRVPQFKKALLYAIAKGVEYRYLTEITEENLVYCKELQKYAELRHLEGIKGNFGVHESEYVAIALIHEESRPVPELICSFAKSLVEGQQYLFETLWNKAIPADHRIREIEEGVREIEKGITQPVTKIIDSSEDIASRSRQVIETSDHLCVCSDFGGLIMLERIAYDPIRRVLEKVQRGEHKGVRWIGTINSKEDVDVVQRFLELGAEIKHLRSTPLNFSVTDKEFNFTVSNMERGSMASSVLISSEPPYVKQFNSLFEQLWSQGIDAADRIREIEEGIENSRIEVIINSQKTQRQYLDLVNSANEEVLLILPTVKAFLREIDIGIIRVLGNIAAKKGVKVMLLSPFDAKIKQEITQLEEEGVAIQPNQKSSRSIFALLIVDKKYSLIIEVRDDSTRDFQKAIGLATFSNSKATVEPLVAIFESLWNQAELYEQLRMANEKLALHDKMQEEFINIAAHELRTPVQPILGMAELKGYDLADGKESIMMTKDEMAIIIRNAHRLERLSSDILEIARIESGNFQLNTREFDLNDVISPLVEDAEDEIRSDDKDIQIHYSSFNILLSGDKDRLAEVVWNLLENAIKFTKKGPISIATKKDDSHVIVTITDSGTGIDPEVLPTLFAKFVTRSEKGTGLGLFISKNIIESHGGRIWGENNTDGKGAIFTFTLPLENHTT